MDKHKIIKARRANIEQYLKGKGEVLLKEGRQYKVKEHSGLVVSGNKWYNHTILKGGNTLDYLIEVEGISFKNAVEILSLQNLDAVQMDNKSNIRNIVIPGRNTNDKRVIAYLVKTRGIKVEIILPLLKQGRIYEATGSHNCVFTGIDEYNMVRYVMQRSTLPGNKIKFEAEGSDKKYSFSLSGTCDSVYIFESPIDLLSYLTIRNETAIQNSHMLSLGGVTDIGLEYYLGRNPNIINLVFCLDNDKTGNDAYCKYNKKYSTRVKSL